MEGRHPSVVLTVHGVLLGQQEQRYLDVSLLYCQVQRRISKRVWNKGRPGIEQRLHRRLVRVHDGLVKWGVVVGDHLGVQAAPMNEQIVHYLGSFNCA